MAKVKANTNESINCSKNAIIIAITIVMLAVVFMYFRNRQQKRWLQLEHFDTQMDVQEEWDSQRQNTNSQDGGKIL